MALDRRGIRLFERRCLLLLPCQRVGSHKATKELPATLEKVSAMRITSLVGSIVLAGAFLVVPARSGAMPRVGFVVSVRVAPPTLPVYAQPTCPVPGYIWEPGYWAYSDEGYYWVPGT